MASFSVYSQNEKVSVLHIQAWEKLEPKSAFGFEAVMEEHLFDLFVDFYRDENWQSEELGRFTSKIRKKFSDYQLFLKQNYLEKIKKTTFQDWMQEGFAQHCEVDEAFVEFEKLEKFLDQIDLENDELVFFSD